MEMNGEKIIKKGKKTAKWVIWGYVICIVTIIVASFVIDYRKETETPEPIDFSTEGTVEINADQYAYLNIEGLTDEVAIYGDTENENSSTNDRYYIALNQGYMYIVDLDFDTINLLKPLQEYLFSSDENAVAPEPVKIYGMTEKVPSELKNYVLDYYNKGAPEEYQISLEEFDLYFGSVLLNVRKEPVDTSMEEAIILFAVFGIVVLLITHIAMSIEKLKIKKYLKKNGYEEELANQLNDFVEEKHYKDKVILTKDFFMDIKNGGFATFKYSDVKWIHIHNVKTYGITATSSMFVYLNDGKTKLNCVEIKGKPTEEFLEIFNKICEKAPVDCLKGYTKETINGYKEYKKEIKRNGN